MSRKGETSEALSIYTMVEMRYLRMFVYWKKSPFGIDTLTSFTNQTINIEFLCTYSGLMFLTMVCMRVRKGRIFLSF